MKHLAFIVLFSGFFHDTPAQESTRRVMHNFSAEALGVGVHYSINYEWLFLRTRDKKLWLGTGIGFSYNTPKGLRNTYYPLRFCAFYGNIRNFYLEAGYDLVSVREQFYHNKWHVWYDVGYEGYHLFHFGIRYQRESKGWHFKVYLMPILNNGANHPYLYFIDKPESDTKRFNYWYGLGIGYSLY
jgi:hypothetical protein